MGWICGCGSLLSIAVVETISIAEDPRRWMSHWLGDRDVPVTGRWVLQDKDAECCSLPSILIDSSIQQLKLRRHKDSLEDRLNPYEEFIVYKYPQLVFRPVVFGMCEDTCILKWMPLCTSRAFGSLRMGQHTRDRLLTCQFACTGWSGHSVGFESHVQTRSWFEPYI